jgi:CRP-like cAMP-binding protein
VSARCGDRDLPLSTAREGECLGEVSLLEPGPASASIRVVKDAILWSMDMEALRAYLMAHTGDAGVMLMGMASCLSYRLRQANHLIQQHHIVPERTSSEEREQAITAGNTPVNVGLFERIKKSLALEKDKKVRISTKIQM